MAGAPAPEVLGDVASDANASDALFFVFIALALGIFTRQALKWTRVPWSVLLLIWGVLLGIGNETYTKGWHYIHPGIDTWENIDPNFLLALILPVLLFGSAFTLEWHTLLRCWGQVLLLAGPGVLIGTALTAVVLHYVFPYGWSWPESLVLGAILSATDPVAVVALLKEVGASTELRTVVEGESLVNDGTAYVLFLLFQRLAEGEHVTAGSVVSLLCQLTLGGPAVGLAFGIAVIFWLRFIYSDDLVEITTTIVAAYAAFIVGNDILGVSGVLAVITLGIFMAAMGKHHISAKVEEPLHVVWDELEFIANTLIFVLAGAIIAGRIYADHLAADRASAVHAVDWGWAVVLWLFLLVIRAFIFVVLYPILRRTGYGITWRTAIIMIWSGVRGAVGLVLALFLLLDARISDREFRTLSFFFVGCIAAITILVQGTTTGPLLMVLGLTKRLSVKRTFLRHILQQVETHGAQHMEGVKAQGGLLGSPDWRTIASLVSLEGDSLLRKYASLRMDSMRHSNRQILDEEVQRARAGASMAKQLNRSHLLRETRSRLLRAVGRAYKDIFERKHILSTHIYALKQATDKAQDAVGSPLCDWKLLEGSCTIPLWVDWLQWFERFPYAGTWVRRRLYAAMEANATRVVAFHYAHADARQTMKEFDAALEDSLDEDGPGTTLLSSEQEGILERMKRNVIEQVTRESLKECEAAENYLLNLRLAYPEVLASVRSRQVAQEVLLVKEDYLAELGHSGLTDEREQAELEGLVERQLKRIHFAPPSTTVPARRASLPRHPLFAALTPEILKKQVHPFLHPKIYQRGSCLTDHTTASDTVLVVLRGAVSLTTGGGQVAAFVDARGLVLGRQGLLVRLLPRAHAAGLTLLATTAVEAYVISQLAYEALLRKHAKFHTRTLQLYGALLASVYGSAVLQDLTFQQLVNIFREAQLQELPAGATLRVVGPAHLLEGQLADYLHPEAGAAAGNGHMEQPAHLGNGHMEQPAHPAVQDSDPQKSADIHVVIAPSADPSVPPADVAAQGPCSLPDGPRAYTTKSPCRVLHLPAVPVAAATVPGDGSSPNHSLPPALQPDKHLWLPATRLCIPSMTRANSSSTPGLDRASEPAPALEHASIEMTTQGSPDSRAASPNEADDIHRSMRQSASAQELRGPATLDASPDRPLSAHLSMAPKPRSSVGPSSRGSPQAHPSPSPILSHSLWDTLDAAHTLPAQQRERQRAAVIAAADRLRRTTRSMGAAPLSRKM